MGKVLKILGIVFLVVIVGFVALLIWAQQTGSKHQEKFYQAVVSGDVDKVVAQLDPRLAAMVDKPVLAAWAKAVKEGLGDFKGLSKSNFNTKSSSKDGVSVLETEGTVLFEKGEGRSTILLGDDKVVRFFLDSDQVTLDFLKDPAIAELCKARGQEFLTSFLTGKADETFELMHAVLQNQLPLEKLSTMIANVTGKVGALKSVAFDSLKYAHPKGESFTLLLYYKVECANDSTTARVTFQFKDMAVHLNSFDLSGG